MVAVRLIEVDTSNWRACADLRVTDEQQRWVADVTYYLCLCTYGGVWHPLAIEVGGKLVGFMMWAIDHDASRWIGGLVIDVNHQRRGIGRAAVIEAVRMLVSQDGCSGVALSYSPDNRAARQLYAGLGFAETDETTDDGEIVGRLSSAAARGLCRPLP